MSSSEPPPALTPGTSARDRKIKSLKEQTSILEKQIADSEAEHERILGKLKNPASPDKTVKAHIKLLHDFNEIRDVGLGLIGMVAENRGTRIQNVMGEFGVSSGD